MIPVNIATGEQFTPHFLAISPNNRMPAIVDHEPKGGGALATVRADSFDLSPMGPEQRCTPLSVAAHTLYENARPDLLAGHRRQARSGIGRSGSERRDDGARDPVGYDHG